MDKFEDELKNGSNKAFIDTGSDRIEEEKEIESAIKSFSKEDIAAGQVFLTPGQIVRRQFFRNHLAVMGIVTLIVIALFCFVGPLFVPYTETEIFYVDEETGMEVRMNELRNYPTAILMTKSAPSKTHLLGTNEMGQDQLVRLMYGGRISLMVGFVVVVVEMLLGVTMGGLAGFYGGWVDMVVMRLVEMFVSIPFIPLMLIISSLLISLKISPQYKIYYTMFIMGVIYWAGVARMIRGNILSLREMEYMQACEATGIRTRKRIFKHLIPNTMPLIIVMATMDLGGVILMESTMSFLGIGVGVPYASWGNMVSSVKDNVVMRNCPWIWITPGIFILLTVLAFNFVGDGLRDAFDPRMKR
jgi:peptide/nickel transport system permease protein